MSDEYTKTVVIRDRSSAPGSALPTSERTIQNGQATPHAPPSETTGDVGYPDFEDTSWLT